uniref:Putative tick transposon n=1 Tax=Rhipicephalus microplus TaxID=6941 RepID=A0A6G4ZYS5_RHIMP
MDKNFREVSVDPTKIKSRALALMNEVGLTKVANEVKREKGLLLQAFFSVKTHKQNYPFRTIVSERRSWLNVISGYLQTNLAQLKLEDPFEVASSNCVVQVLQNNNPGGCFGFSIDIEDLYYSLPHVQLLKFVQQTIEGQMNELGFVESCKIPVASFLELLEFYLKSTIVQWQGRTVIQRAGVCIGSCVAPVLSSIF